MKYVILNSVIYSSMANVDRGPYVMKSCCRAVVP